MTSRSSESSSKVIETTANGLGTFGGVFTPSILTILGVIMYLRFGWVVGQMGLVNTLLIVTISTSITFITGLSISAIATDQVVRAGGAYYMISRSLGIETGGAVGIPLYFAQALSVALYTIGFAESVKNAFPNVPITITVLALVTTIAVTALALKSADIAIKAQYVIMAAIVLSLVSLVFGSSVNPADIPATEEAGSVSFWAVLAVFFPAVTGIMSGVNMSGDLKDPKKSIPMGTLAAVGVGYVIYMSIPLLLSNRADSASLISDPLIMRRMAFWGDAILLGVWGATLSSALGSILGAPRVLQALARDNILPKRLRWLGHGHGPTDEPRLGTLFTLGVVLAVVCIGDLDAIAPVLTMFFLTTYMVLNVAAGIEGFLQSPSFRPTFRIPWYISLLGALGCIAIMFLINPAATVAAAIIVLTIYLWLERREIRTTWGDVRQGIWLSLVRAGLNNIADSADPKNWRPHLLVLSGAPTKRWHLIELATDFTHNRGLITLASILPTGARNLKQQEQMRSTIRDYLEKRDIQAFVKLIEARDTSTGAQQLIDTYGIGPLMPNTVLLGDTETDDHEARERYCQIISKCHQAKRNIVILRNPPSQMPQFPKRIDVWWGGLQANGGLMLILAYLLRTGMRWRSADIFLKLVVSNQAAAQAAQTNLNKLIDTLSIGAQPKIIVAEGRPFDSILRSSSATADLILMGLATPDDEFTEYYTSLQNKTMNLPPTIFVLAAEDLAFSELLQKE
ncbi:amino acid transporter [Leptolyngbya sp. Heron Island J]|uniref:amino acid permease n=1 Tax=Leptolyngbya sp. Heron Island J TaxID=1385935 RepID=UPI0003B98FF1|nr:amino acid permease [Leptolyngbya sp. Heron Island J]ESA39008.1 amino acid transporter [Leptolyngbya sp. Heron Island J]